MAKRGSVPTLEEREFRSIEEIDSGIAKFERRIRELEGLNLQEAVLTHNGADDVAKSNVQAAIREVFGVNSPEFREHKYLDLWAGPMYMGMSDDEIIEGKRRGTVQTIGILKGLIGRLKEKRDDLSGGTTPTPSTYFDRLNLHPRIREVSRDRFLDGYPWDAVFAASKALVNYVKERSGRHDLDGAPLMTTVLAQRAGQGGVAEFFPECTTPSNEAGVYVYVMSKCTHTILNLDSGQ